MKAHSVGLSPCKAWEHTAGYRTLACLCSLLAGTWSWAIYSESGSGSTYVSCTTTLGKNRTVFKGKEGGKRSLFFLMIQNKNMSKKKENMTRIWKHTRACPASNWVINQSWGPGCPFQGRMSTPRGWLWVPCSDPAPRSTLSHSSCFQGLFRAFLQQNWAPFAQGPIKHWSLADSTHPLRKQERRGKQPFEVSIFCFLQIKKTESGWIALGFCGRLWDLLAS